MREGVAPPSSFLLWYSQVLHTKAEVMATEQLCLLGVAAAEPAAAPLLLPPASQHHHPCPAFLPARPAIMAPPLCTLTNGSPTRRRAGAAGPLPDRPRGCTRSATAWKRRCDWRLYAWRRQQRGSGVRRGGTPRVAAAGQSAGPGLEQTGRRSLAEAGSPPEGASPPRAARCEGRPRGSGWGPGCCRGPRGLRVRRMALEF